MASPNQIINGLQILNKYTNGDSDEMYAEHDVIFGPDVSEELINSLDLEKLNELRWRFGGEYDCWYHYN